MVGPRHADLDALSGQCVGDARIVRRHHHVRRARLQGALRQAHHHRHAGDGEQGLAR